jgi:MarR family transcriptional regulator, organic hydroperoxide resistance regulator
LHTIELRTIQLCVNSSDLLRLDAQLCFLLYAATRAVTQAYVPLLAPLGLTYPQYLVMLVLWEQDGVPLGHIGDRLHLDSGTLTPLIKRMEAAGLVVRERSHEDERILIVSLSEAGRRLRARATGVPVQLFCQTGLSSTAADRLATDLRRVLESLRTRPDGANQSTNDNNRRQGDDDTNVDRPIPSSPSGPERPSLRTVPGPEQVQQIRHDNDNDNNNDHNDDKEPNT